MRSSCNNSLRLHNSGPAASLQVFPTSDTCQSVAILMNGRHCGFFFHFHFRHGESEEADSRVRQIQMVHSYIWVNANLFLCFCLLRYLHTCNRHEGEFATQSFLFPIYRRMIHHSRERITDTRLGSGNQTKKNELARMGIEPMTLDKRSNALTIELLRPHTWTTIFNCVIIALAALPLPDSGQAAAIQTSGWLPASDTRVTCFQPGGDFVIYYYYY